MQYALKIFFSILACCLPLSVKATPTIVGGTINNGDFNADTSTDDQRSFDDTLFWENIGTGNQNATATRTNLTSADNSRNAVVAESATREFGLDTGYTLVIGEELSISYEWRDGFNWDDGSDQLIVNLFFTDTGTIDGVRTDLASLFSGFSTSNSTYQTFMETNFITIGAAEAGENLFIEITSQDGNNVPDGFARLDNFTLTTSIPELSSTVLLGLGGFAFIFNRRK